MPTILAIETSSELASCALLRGASLTSRDSSGVRTHSQSILPMVQALLAEAGIALSACDAIAYGAGPGSFTGVRTACGIAQGLAFGAGLPVVPVITLEAMALACRQRVGAADVLTVLDARMGEVYWARYRYAQDDARQCATVVDAPALSAPDAVRFDGAVTACGNGLSAYPDALAALAPATPHGAWSERAAIMPHARQIAQLARAAVAAGATLTPAEAQPLYLRNKIAFTSAERLDIQLAKAAAEASR
ncbi:MAG: tRNA (adenosine(37)-N6)-threonylcarbamoyltransferase complex dimerization subunit type 1 TsaB [Pseudomonadota bacterium]